MTVPKPVFSDYTVFWAVFALKARKLPDLSGRQIRQLICDISTKRNIEKGVFPKSTPVDILSINILLLKIKGLSAILIIRV